MSARAGGGCPSIASFERADLFCQYGRRLKDESYLFCIANEECVSNSADIGASIFSEIAAVHTDQSCFPNQAFLAPRFSV